MKDKTSSSPSIVVAGQSRVIRAFGDEIHVHLDTEQTGGKFTLFTDMTPPGGGPPPHYHDTEDETFFVLEGRAQFFQDGKWIGSARRLGHPHTQRRAPHFPQSRRSAA